MTRCSVSRLAIIAAFSALPGFALAPAARAQTSSQTAGSPAPQSDNNPTPAAALSQKMQEKVDAHIDGLHAELQITASEETAWKQFAQVMRDNAAQMEQAFTARSGNLGTMTAAQNMQSYAHLAQVHATNMQKLASTFQTLYNSFPQSQKQAADSVFRNRAQKTPAAHSG